ncbi:MocR-like pyridoxine biosynthesis transcription factor PdxR [Chitinilyticum aquatile]|uniref:MocR-like pyridoxine biosynthesis transcription factor PdxR n=1 Tax=Chitinilyticum aquatile TaxID=362520 RepID=UPI0004102A78|nr:PLP-dependent aminotransferase family protein [Chitinilyticum aquatile]
MDYALLLDPHGNHSRQQQLYLGLRAAILDGRLAGGTRLPASRELAGELRIARNAVVYAYEQLASEGLVHASARGTVVAPLNRPGQLQPAAHTAAQQLSQRGGAFRTPFAEPEPASAFTPGVPALGDFPLARWQKRLARAWRCADAATIGYGPAAGEPALREAIASHLRSTRGVRCDTAQLFITDGTQHGLDLCARLFADAGNTAWIENPGYHGALNAWRTAQLEVRGIAVDEHGLRPLAADWQQHPPRLIYVTPSHQYPLGSVLSLERRLQLIADARAHGTLIIEDDYDSEFRRDGPPLPAMQGLEADAPVVYLGTFSKTLFPALRIGFMIVPAALVVQVEAALAQCQPRGRQIEQRALAGFIRDGEFLTHLRRMRKLYSERRDAMLAAIHRHFGELAEVCGGSSGIHLAIRIPASIPDSLISQQARAAGLIARPLSAYRIGNEPDSASNGFILGYAQVPADEMDGQIAMLAQLVRQHASRLGDMPHIPSGDRAPNHFK